MTTSRLKRLGKLEQVRTARTREQLERLMSSALDALTPEQRAAVAWWYRPGETPEGQAAVSRLLEWANTVPEIRDAPELGKAAAQWPELRRVDGLRPLSPASAEVVKQLEQYAAQWLSVAARTDCPEPEAARGLAGNWELWAAVARLTREKGETF